MEINAHADAVQDTGEAYTSFQGWVLTCLWCDCVARGKTKRQALERMQEHYDRECGAGRVVLR